MARRISNACTVFFWNRDGAQHWPGRHHQTTLGTAAVKTRASASLFPLGNTWPINHFFPHWRPERSICYGRPRVRRKRNRTNGLAIGPVHVGATDVIRTRRPVQRNRPRVPEPYTSNNEPVFINTVGGGLAGRRTRACDDELVFRPQRDRYATNDRVVFWSPGTITALTLRRSRVLSEC